MGGLVALVALVVPIESLADFISLGSLYAFTTVDVGLMQYRYGDGMGGHRSRRCFLLLMLFWVLSIISTLLINLQPSLSIADPKTIAALVLMGGLVAIGVVFAVLPQRDDLRTLVFRTPLVPLVPLVGIFVNTLMMTARSALTYYSFLVWFALGLLIYFFYGMQHSGQRRRDGESMAMPSERDLLVPRSGSGPDTASTNGDLH